MMHNSEQPGVYNCIVWTPTVNYKHHKLNDPCFHLSLSSNSLVTLNSVRGLAGVHSQVI